MASSSSSSRRSMYQVFLSFRGEDTRHSFTSFLLQALEDKGIGVFFDDKKLQKGEELSPALLEAIAASKISIVILSKDYASSKSCLTELFEIMERKRAQLQAVIPIFYHVDPSDVRKHGGSFRKSFDEHLMRNPDEANRWKAAFSEVGKLKGWHIVGHFSDRSEPVYIREIVQDVIEKLNSNSLNSSEEFVGIDYQKKKIISLLRIPEEETCILGICGMGGIGKTTLAEIVYNEISHQFADHYFLLNVREKLEKQGVESLRDELLSKILKQEIRIGTRFIGSTLIQDRLRSKRVFVVLDDVNDSDQIECLGVKHFSHGSKIIVTSRDKQVLENVVDLIYEVEKLNEDDSLQLFSKFAFKQHHPNGDLQDLSNRFVEYAGGIPLALKVLGPTLYRKPREYWESALDKLKEYPEPKIFKILKISFDGLDRLERNIFLDIACFFKGEDRGDAIKMLKSYYKGAYFGICNLMDKCLVSISVLNTFAMHDLVQEMGWDIVRQESKYPGKRSRLWSPDDVYRVLKNNKGTEAIEGISLNMAQISSVLQLSPSVFEKMDNLRVINFYYTLFSENQERKLLLLNDQDLKSLPDELRYLHWEYCPFKSLPSNFSPENLVQLKLSHCNMDQLWNGKQNVVNLKVVDLKHCKNLTKISNLSQAVNVEKLTIGECPSLDELPRLNHLESLSSLDVSKCPITKFPEIPTNLTSLSLRKTEIEEVPSLIGRLNKLEYLDMSDSKIQSLPSSIAQLHDLDYIGLSGCTNITSFPNVSESIIQLDLDCTQIEEIPSSISRLKSLCTLNMRDCRSLKSISNLPPCLRWFVAHGCRSLQSVSRMDQYECEPHDSKTWQCIIFADCFNLNQDAIDNIVANAMFRSECIAKQLVEELRDEFYEDYKGQVVCCFPGREISQSFEYQSTGSSIIASLGPDRTGRFLGFVLCIVVDLKCSHENCLDVDCEWQLKTKSGDYHNFKIVGEWPMYDDESIPLEFSKRVLVLFDSEMVMEESHYEEASFQFSIRDNYKKIAMDDIEVEKCGVHVFYVDAKKSDHYMVEYSGNSSSDDEGVAPGLERMESSSAAHLPIIQEENSCDPDMIPPKSPVVNSSDFGISVTEDSNIMDNNGGLAIKKGSGQDSNENFSSSDDEDEHKHKRLKPSDLF